MVTWLVPSAPTCRLAAALASWAAGGGAWAGGGGVVAAAGWAAGVLEAGAAVAVDAPVSRMAPASALAAVCVSLSGCRGGAKPASRRSGCGVGAASGVWGAGEADGDAAAGVGGAAAVSRVGKAVLPKGVAGVRLGALALGAGVGSDGRAVARGAAAPVVAGLDERVGAVLETGPVATICEVLAAGAEMVSAGGVATDEGCVARVAML